MGSPKQHIYCRLINHGFVLLRSQYHSAVDNTALANLLHNVHRSILEPEFVQNDIGFVNDAIPHYLQHVAGNIEPQLATLFLAFYDAVPEQRRSQLTWHPSTELRALTSSQPEQEALIAAFEQLLSKHI